MFYWPFDTVLADNPINMPNSKAKTRYPHSMYQAFNALLICTTLLCGFIATPSQAEQDAPKVELKLEGEFIERLVLSSGNEQDETFADTNQTIELAPGKYHVKEVSLKGGYTFRYYPFPQYTLVEVDTTKTNVLKIGGPLHQTVQVQRRGGILVLNYKLLGVAGETYSLTNPKQPPQFSVYSGENQIASGQFEYG